MLCLGCLFLLLFVFDGCVLALSFPYLLVYFVMVLAFVFCCWLCGVRCYVLSSSCYACSVFVWFVLLFLGLVFFVLFVGLVLCVCFFCCCLIVVVICCLCGVCVLCGVSVLLLRWLCV